VEREEKIVESVSKQKVKERQFYLQGSRRTISSRVRTGGGIFCGIIKGAGDSQRERGD